MSTLYYLDANPLVAAAVASTSVATTDEQSARTTLLSLVERPDSALAVSGMTLLEVHDVELRKVRGQGYPLTQTWMDRSHLELMTWIELGQIEVLAAPARLFRESMELVEMVHRKSKQSLKAKDAMHLQLATSWARSFGKQVTLVTHDSDFTKFMDVFPEFGKHVQLLDIQI